MSLRTSLPLSALAGTAIFCAAACTTTEPQLCEGREATVVDPAGVNYRYVVQSIELPSSGSQAREIALDLDDNSIGDNLIGANVFGLISQFSDYDLSAEANALVETGELLQLIDVRTTSLDDALGVGVRVGVGLDVDAFPSDNHSGQEPLAFDTSVAPGQMSGALLEGRVSVDLGTAPLALTFPGLGESIIFPLTGARLEATITEDGLQGKIAGAISLGDVDVAILPALELGFERAIARDCPGQQCVVDSFGETLIGVFDASDPVDYVITQEELRNNSLIEAIFRPDLDLYNQNGEFAPGCDGVNESLSLTVGFTAVRAEIPSS